jgi:outer membrane protein assembly factor BamB
MLQPTAGTVHSLNRNTGEALWIKTCPVFPGSLVAQPLLCLTGYFGNHVAAVYALALLGKVYFWLFPCLIAFIHIRSGIMTRAYIFSIGMSAAAVDLKSGEKLWQVEIPVPVRTPLGFN